MRLARTRAAIAAVIAPALLLAGPTPAQAAVTAVRDGDDATIDADIHRTRIEHGDYLVVRVKLDRLRRSDRRVFQGMNVYVDLWRRHRGPEVMVEAGLALATPTSSPGLTTGPATWTVSSTATARCAPRAAPTSRCSGSTDRASGATTRAPGSR